MRLLRFGFGTTLLATLIGAGCGKKDAAPAPAPTAPAAPAAPVVAAPPVKPPAGDEAPARTGGPLAEVIPTNALGFVCINVKALWNSPEGAEGRRVISGVQPGALGELEREVGLGVAPEFIDQVAFVLHAVGEQPLTMVAHSNPHAKDKIRETVVHKPREEEYKGKKLYVMPGMTFSPPSKDKDKGAPRSKDKDKEAPPREANGMALLFVSDAVFMVGGERQVRAWIDQSTKPEKGPLSEAIKKVAEGHHLVVAGAPARVEHLAIDVIPPRLQPVAKASVAVLVGDIGKESRFRLNLTFPDESSAKEGEAAITSGVAMLQDLLPKFTSSVYGRDLDNPFRLRLTQVLLDANEGLKGSTTKRDGVAVSAAVTVKSDLTRTPPGEAEAIQTAQRRMRSLNNVKQIALSFHNFASTYADRLPPAAICDKAGKPLLSWRVLLLPYIEEDALYREFKLDEAWDGPHNKPLLAKMPKIYMLPGVDAKDYLTHYQVFVGPGTLFHEKPVLRDFPMFKGQKSLASKYTIANIPDGTSNTILVAEAAQGVPWSKPDDIHLDPTKPVLPLLGKMYPDRFVVAIADGSVRWLNKKKISEKTLRIAIDPGDGLPLGRDWDDAGSRR
jgi:hypothetical protein